MNEQDTKRKQHEDEVREALADLEIRDQDAVKVTGGSSDPCEGGQISPRRSAEVPVAARLMRGSSANHLADCVWRKRGDVVA